MVKAKENEAMERLNLYGDVKSETIGGMGVDVASQRADDLDNMALHFLGTFDKRPRALDAGSAAGGMGLRMALTGAEVVAVDINDYASAFMAAAKRQGLMKRCRFVKLDLAYSDILEKLGLFDVIVAQRFIHYFPFSVAVDVVRNMKGALAKDGRLYISASGTESELAIGYSHMECALENRHARLAHEMSKKHAIHESVTLYSQDDMEKLLMASGLKAKSVFVSPFGNVKAVAVALE